MQEIETKLDRTSIRQIGIERHQATCACLDPPGLLLRQAPSVHHLPSLVMDALFAAIRRLLNPIEAGPRLGGSYGTPSTRAHGDLGANGFCTASDCSWK